MGEQVALALITGATSGIGEAIANKMAGEGWDLWLTGRRQDRLSAICRGLADRHKVKVKGFNFDIRSRTEVEDFLSQNSSELSQVEVLINNAGLAKGGEKFQDSKMEDWEQMIDTNIKGLLYLTRGVAPVMASQRRGTIINLGSAAGRWVYPTGSVYCATKFAVRALSEGLRMDLLGTGIRVCNIEPGMVETEFSVVRFDSEERAKQVYEGMRPLTAKDISESIYWMISQPAHINIQELVIMPTAQAAVGQVHRDNSQQGSKL